MNDDSTSSGVALEAVAADEFAPAPPPEPVRPADLAGPAFRATLAETLGRLGVGYAPDLTVVCDGSGSGWSLGGGGAAVLFTAAGDRKLITAGFSAATSMRMELVPFVLALDWFHDVVGRKRPGKSWRVVCLSDNETVVEQGAGRMGIGVLRPWWAAIDVIKRQGYVLDWRWIPRDSVGLNRLCDHLSRAARLNHGQVALEAVVPGVSVYDVNP